MGGTDLQQQNGVAGAGSALGSMTRNVKDIKPASNKDIKPASNKDTKPASNKDTKPNATNVKKSWAYWLLLVALCCTVVGIFAALAIHLLDVRSRRKLEQNRIKNETALTTAGSEHTKEVEQLGKNVTDADAAAAEVSSGNKPSDIANNANNANNNTSSTQPTVKANLQTENDGNLNANDNQPKESDNNATSSPDLPNSSTVQNEKDETAKASSKAENEKRELEKKKVNDWLCDITKADSLPKDNFFVKLSSNLSDYTDKFGEFGNAFRLKDKHKTAHDLLNAIKELVEKCNFYDVCKNFIASCSPLEPKGIDVSLDEGDEMARIAKERLAHSNAISNAAEALKSSEDNWKKLFNSFKEDFISAYNVADDDTSKGVRLYTAVFQLLLYSESISEFANDIRSHISLGDQTNFMQSDFFECIVDCIQLLTVCIEQKAIVESCHEMRESLLLFSGIKSSGKSDDFVFHAKHWLLVILSLDPADFDYKYILVTLLSQSLGAKNAGFTVDEIDTLKGQIKAMIEDTTALQQLADIMTSVEKNKGVDKKYTADDLKLSMVNVFFEVLKDAKNAAIAKDKTAAEKAEAAAEKAEAAAKDAEAAAAAAAAAAADAAAAAAAKAAADAAYAAADKAAADADTAYAAAAKVSADAADAADAAAAANVTAAAAAAAAAADTADLTAAAAADAAADAAAKAAAAKDAKDAAEQAKAAAEKAKTAKADAKTAADAADAANTAAAAAATDAAKVSAAAAAAAVVAKAKAAKAAAKVKPTTTLEGGLSAVVGAGAVVVA